MRCAWLTPAKARRRELTVAFGKLLRGKLAESISGLAALIFLELKHGKQAI
jgi:hypothetical protein